MDAPLAGSAVQHNTRAESKERRVAQLMGALRHRSQHRGMPLSRTALESGWGMQHTGEEAKYQEYKYHGLHIAHLYSSLSIFACTIIFTTIWWNDQYLEDTIFPQALYRAAYRHLGPPRHAAPPRHAGPPRHAHTSRRPLPLPGLWPEGGPVRGQRLLRGCGVRALPLRQAEQAVSAAEPRTVPTRRSTPCHPPS